MDSTVTEAGPFERVVTVRIPAAQLHSAEERAARRLSRDIRVAGFRPGKAPRRIVESMVGAERIRNAALEDALPDLVTSALAELELNPAVVPSVTDTRDTLDGVEVDLTVTLWPKLDGLPDYEDRRIVIDRIAVDDAETDAQVERLLAQYAELEPVERPAETGDYVMIDIGATRDGDPLASASTTDFLYEVGSELLFEGLDDLMVGAEAGDVHEIETDLPAHRYGDDAGPADIEVRVKGVRAARLPELSDEWVSDISEFETVAEMRAELERRLVDHKRTEASTEVRNRLLTELIEELDLVLPDGLIQAEMEAAAERFAHQLQHAGIDPASYFEITGQDQDAFFGDLRTQAEINLRRRILLDAIVESEGLEVDADEVNATIDRLAEAARQTADEYRKQFREAGQVQALVGDMLRQKALDLLAERATAVDGDGSVVVLSPPGENEHDNADDDGGTVPAEVIE